MFSKAAQGKRERGGITDPKEIEAIEEREFQEWMAKEAGDEVEKQAAAAAAHSTKGASAQMVNPAEARLRRLAVYDFIRATRLL